MNFRSLNDMTATIRRSLPLLPREIDVVVGVPRSGLVPALAIALYRNVMATDVEGFIAGRAFAPGPRRPKPRLVRDPAAWRTVLVVDDSIDSGETMREVRARLEPRAEGLEIHYCAIYGTAARYPGVEYVLDICPRQRIFEWNLLHQPVHMGRACVDIDGLFYPDPEGGTGAFPRLVPTVPVRTLVTSRPEATRAEVEGWLRRDGIDFGELRMPGSIPAGGAQTDAFKTEVFASLPDAALFVESDGERARTIARLSGKPVISTGTMTLY